MGDDKERLLRYVQKKSIKEDYDFYILGHRHLPFDIKINDKSRYINVGDWIRNFSYVVFDGSKLELKKYEG